MECPICFNILMSDKISILRCNHTICTPCFQRLETMDQNTCPICRSVTFEIQPVFSRMISHLIIPNNTYNADSNRNHRNSPIFDIKHNKRYNIEQLKEIIQNL